MTGSEILDDPGLLARVLDVEGRVDLEELQGRPSGDPVELAKAVDLRRGHPGDLLLVGVQGGHSRGDRSLEGKPPVARHQVPGGVVPSGPSDVLTGHAQTFGEPEPELRVVRLAV